jgi:hypothetical protein
MNISPPHRPIPLHRPWWSRRAVALGVAALALGGSAALAFAGMRLTVPAASAIAAQAGRHAPHEASNCATGTPAGAAKQARGA